MKDTDPLSKPFLDKGNLLLIGDAAHALLPTIGMGASLAIEDAELLGKRIADVVNSQPAERDKIRERFNDLIAKPYAKKRVPVWENLMGRARLAGQENFVNQASKKRFATGPAIPNTFLSRIVTAIEHFLRKLS